MRKRQLRKGFVGLGLSMACLVLFSGPASASVCGQMLPAGFPLSHQWYFTANYGGQIQCAGKWTSVSRDFYWGIIDGYSESKAGKDIFCSNAFALPAGWVVATAAIQVHNGSAWVTIKTGPTGYNAANTAVAEAGVREGTYGNARTVSGHSVVSAGDWRHELQALTCT